MKMLLKLILTISVLTQLTQAECPVTENPRDVIDCLRYISSGLYGVAVQNMKVICSIASDISRCAQKQMGQCIAAQIGVAALKEIENIADNCCPDRNRGKCPIRDSALSEQRCFAADSFVTLSDGHRKSIIDLQPGDSVLAYHDQTKQIVPTRFLTMLDYQPLQFAMFKQVTTVTGRQLSLTSSHLLPTDIHGYVMAKNVRAGMVVHVMTDDGVLIGETVSNVSDVVKQGFVAPLTAEGTVIVNGVAASCYATINSHHVAHAVLTPMRWWYGVMEMEKEEGTRAVGVHWFAKMLYEITAYLLPSVIQK